MKGDVDVGMKTGVVDADLHGTADPTTGFTAGADVRLNPELRDVASGTAGAVAATLIGGWMVPALAALGLGVWFYRRKKVPKEVENG